MIFTIYPTQIANNESFVKKEITETTEIIENVKSMSEKQNAIQLQNKTYETSCNYENEICFISYDENMIV